MQQAIELASPNVSGQQPGHRTGLPGKSPRELLKPKVDRAGRPVHPDAVACPWRVPAWKQIREEERREKFSGKGTFVFGRRVPYQGGIVVPSPTIDSRMVSAFAHRFTVRRQVPVQPLCSASSRLSYASVATTARGRMHRDQQLQKRSRSAVSKHINYAHRSPATTQSVLLSALLSPRASPYAMPQKLPALAKPDLQRSRLRVKTRMSV